MEFFQGQAEPSCNDTKYEECFKDISELHVSVSLWSLLIYFIGKLTGPEELEIALELLGIYGARGVII